MPKAAQLTLVEVDSAAPVHPKGKRRGLTSVAPGALPPQPDLSLAAHPLDVERTVFSADRSHRFTLFRAFKGGNPNDFIAGIGMNPSRADEVHLDPSVRKMCAWARDRWRAGGFYMLNALSIRLTDSTKLGDFDRVSLPENDEWIRRIAGEAKFVVVCWGNPGHEHGRGAEVERILRKVCDPKRVFCFGKNQNGSPKHPLYLPFKTALLPYFT